MRKLPKQARSKALVASLIEATARSITVHGLDGFTTHHVAEYAGVSVGSLYQYFDSKEDLVQALLDQQVERLAAGLSHLVQAQQLSLPAMVELAVHFGFSFLRADDGLAMELVRNWHRLPTQQVVRVLQDTLLDFMRLYFLKNPRYRQPERLQVRSFIVANSLVFTMIRAISSPSPFITEEELAQELIQMVVSYLES